MARKNFTVILLPLETGGYQAYFPDFPACITVGDNPADAFGMAQNALKLYLEVEAVRGGNPILEPTQASYVVIGALEVEVPAALLSQPEPAAQPVS